MPKSATIEMLQNDLHARLNRSYKKKRASLLTIQPFAKEAITKANSEGLGWAQSLVEEDEEEEQMNSNHTHRPLISPRPSQNEDRVNTPSRSPVINKGTPMALTKGVVRSRLECVRQREISGKRGISALATSPSVIYSPKRTASKQTVVIPALNLVNELGDFKDL